MWTQSVNPMFECEIQQWYDNVYCNQVIYLLLDRGSSPPRLKKPLILLNISQLADLFCLPPWSLEAWEMRNWFVLKRFLKNNFILDHTFFPVLALKKTTDFPLKIDFPRINSTLPHPCSNKLIVICASCFRLQQHSLCTLSSFCNRHDEQPFCLQLRHYELKITSFLTKRNICEAPGVLAW